MKGAVEQSGDAAAWCAIEAAVHGAVKAAHPGVEFTDIWLESRTSWCGRGLVDVWAIYEGEPADLGVPIAPSLLTRIQDILWDKEVDASPITHLVAKADAGDLRPETV